MPLKFWKKLLLHHFRHEKVQENCIDLVGRIADRGAEFVPAKEWMRICFELLELLKAHKKAIRRATVNTFGYIAKAIGLVINEYTQTLINPSGRRRVIVVSLCVCVSVCYHLISATVRSCKISKICSESWCNDGPEIKAICCETPVSLRDKRKIMSSQT